MAIYRSLTLLRRIRSLRISADYTQTELATKLNMSQASYSRLEVGEVEISFSRLCDIADVYGLSVSKLVENL